MKYWQFLRDIYINKWNIYNLKWFCEGSKYPENRLLRLYLLIFDLEAIFNKQLYVHPGFMGKTSIKYVLPVICPDLSYKTLYIGDGQTAAIRWYHMASRRHAECENIYEDLCKYCHLDTLAMVKIFKVLEAL